jgi:putative ABC transport system ATP-binding protein
LEGSRRPRVRVQLERGPDGRDAGLGDAGPLFRFDDVVVTGRLAGVSLEVPSAGVTVVQGPSGAGKSTLLRCCNRLEAPDSGTVLYRGRNLAGLDVLAHRREVGMVFQAPVVFPGTVADNVRMADPGAGVEALLERVGLEATLATRAADRLSGGEAQRVCLARALATQPRVLLADEPTSSLDPEAMLLLEGLLRELADDGVPVILVTHDAGQARRLAGELVRMSDGRVAAP